MKSESYEVNDRTFGLISHYSFRSYYSETSKYHLIWHTLMGRDLFIYLLIGWLILFHVRHQQLLVRANLMKAQK